MPLDIWIARTKSFEAIHGPHTRGGLPTRELAAFLSQSGGSRRGDEWWFRVDGRPGWIAEPVLDVDATYLRLSVSMSTPELGSRLRGAAQLAAKASAEFDARAFEATAGREIRGEPSSRWVMSRESESERMRERMDANGLAPLEFPFRNLDAVSNFVTWVVEPGDGAGASPPDVLTGALRFEESDDGAWKLTWNWRQAPFEAAWEDGLSQIEDLDGHGGRITFDGRAWGDELSGTLHERNDELATEFYRWWVDARDGWRSA